VAKASLYNTFGSKDELVRAYLSARHDRRRERITATVAERETPREKVLAVFDLLAAIVAEPGFRGCAFARASAESDVAGTVREVTVEQRGWVRGLLAELAPGAGAVSPEALAEQLVLLYDGAMTSAQLDGNKHAAVAARELAGALVDAAT
jgi:AcrR family transcriptional regulator